MIEFYLFLFPCLLLFSFLGAVIPVTIGYLLWRYVLCSTCFTTLLSRCSFLSTFDWGILKDDSLCDSFDRKLL